MSTWQFVALGLTIWALTLFTFLLGYTQGKSSGFVMGRRGRLDNNDKALCPDDGEDTTYRRPSGER